MKRLLLRDVSGNLEGGISLGMAVAMYREESAENESCGKYELSLVSDMLVRSTAVCCERGGEEAKENWEEGSGCEEKVRFMLESCVRF